ncbi:hypothetical protein QO200_06325 [Flavobacterium sp. Arc3]|jgi:hypothetical protein|uniref:hypothetical protein n=1 Tax=unclassified Flavobacterium TaxID=196869 RepID=UPI00352D019D
MKSKIPDNVVYSVEERFNGNILPYGTNVGSLVIRFDNAVSWKSRGIDNVNKELGNKFNELKIQYQKLELMEE